MSDSTDERIHLVLAIAVLVTTMVLALVVGFFAPRPTIIHIVRTPSPSPEYFKMP